jgi:hypothetical protein
MESTKVSRVSYHTRGGTGGEVVASGSGDAISTSDMSVLISLADFTFSSKVYKGTYAPVQLDPPKTMQYRIPFLIGSSQHNDSGSNVTKVAVQLWSVEPIRLSELGCWPIRWKNLYALNQVRGQLNERLVEQRLVE